MAKHRLEQPNRGSSIAKKAMIAGSLTVGSLAVAAGPALAAPAPSATIEIPNLGKFTLPGIDQNQVPNQFRPGGGGGGITAPVDTAAQKAVRAAESKIGAPYVYGAAGPNAFDCSGLVYWSYQQAGKTIPRDSYGQLGGGRAVNYADAQPGDVLIFNGGSHAGLYIGNGQFIQASTEGVPVEKSAVKGWSLTGVRRY
ncbi:C40 family peptidase [Gordonia sp. DT30]|uniref:C40 family peptidase n=1 Tax=unclassified Gordonia (in: high G+C Gram-positive bacteria) TaxID=2657482 RepID=UPI003CF85D98